MMIEKSISFEKNMNISKTYYKNHYFLQKMMQMCHLKKGKKSFLSI